MSGFSVRSASVDDADGIAEVHVASWRSAYRGLLPQSFLDGLVVDGRAEVWARHIAEATLELRVAVDDAGVVSGFIATGSCEEVDGVPIGELGAIYLREEWWGRGMGRALHDAGVESLSRRFGEAILWVLDGNVRARGFYEHCGWHADGGVKQAMIRDIAVEEVRYRLRLSASGSRL